MSRGCQTKEQPHAKQTKPREKLDECQLLHRSRHVANGRSDLFKQRRERFSSLLFELLEVLRRIFLRSDHRPQNRQKKRACPDLERVLYGERDSARGSAGHSEVAKQIR